MIKTATSLLVLIGLICLLQLFLPWYGVALAGMLVTLLLQQRSALAAFLLGLVGGALVWGSYSGYLNAGNEGILAGRLGQTFGGLSGWAMVLVTALLGGIYGGLGALSGYLG